MAPQDLSDGSRDRVDILPDLDWALPARDDDIFFHISSLSLFVPRILTIMLSTDLCRYIKKSSLNCIYTVSTAPRCICIILAIAFHSQSHSV